MLGSSTPATNELLWCPLLALTSTGTKFKSVMIALLEAHGRIRGSRFANPNRSATLDATGMRGDFSVHVRVAGRSL